LHSLTDNAWGFSVFYLFLRDCFSLLITSFMTTIRYFLFFGSVLLGLSSCGPAAEDREAMYARAKVFQDSIANVIKQSMDEAAAPAEQAPEAAAPQPTAAQ
jgi:hypothetical protein